MSTSLGDSSVSVSSDVDGAFMGDCGWNSVCVACCMCSGDIVAIVPFEGGGGGVEVRRASESGRMSRLQNISSRMSIDIFSPLCVTILLFVRFDDWNILSWICG